MTLLTDKDRKVLPRLREADSTDNAVAHVRLFSPRMGWSWYITEWDGGEIAFGLVDGFEVELGDIYLTELAESGVVLRDSDWVPASLRIVRNDINIRRQIEASFGSL